MKPPPDQTPSSPEPEARPRALLAAVQLTSVEDADFLDGLAELGRLATTLGFEVVGEVTQKRDALHAGTYFGSGKLAEIAALVEAKQATFVLTDHELSPSQARNLENAVDVDVMDRTAVILEIFHRHAHSRAARAQVEIVRLQYLAPRLREQGKGRDRQRGGIGGKGAGESSLELDRRKIRDRIAELTAELESLETEQQTRRARRREQNRVALVGYTNAGKSTLMRALTGSAVYVADKLFATLDTTVRTLHPETRPRVLLSDTVGFIDNLPHGLVSSFKTTLDEALEASLLLHVIDASDRGWRRQMDVTDRVLAEIGADDLPRLRVFNKIDRFASAEEQVQATQQFASRFPDAVIMSAYDPEDVRHLHEAIAGHFQRFLVEDELRVPYAAQHLRGPIYEACEVLSETYEADAVVFRLRGPAQTISSLQAAAKAPPRDAA
ncbi:MAG: GTPase HflX [Myxococcales bacterium]|nr:GTPase HflX [Myxococcales bacterium]